MRYPIRKPMVAACIALAVAAFPAITISSKSHKNAPVISAEASTPVPNIGPSPAPAPAPMPANLSSTTSQELYNDIQLGSNGMEPQVFDLALKGLGKLSAAGKIVNTDKITIVDFSQPSNQKRLYVIDLNKKQLLFQSLVAHGRSTGELWARSFSNEASSYKSSPGFYITDKTYRGHNGYSLRLEGLEKGINDNARSRAIVMHGARYASESSVHTLGFLGRSEGCPALPLSLYKPIINTIKNGTCLFIYTPDESYLTQSEWLTS